MAEFRTLEKNGDEAFIPDFWGGFFGGEDRRIGTNEDLTDVDLSRYDLSDLDLSGANFTGAIFENTRISNVNLERTNLTDVDLSNLKNGKVDEYGTFYMVESGNIIGTPTLPAGYMMFNGYILGKAVDLTNADLTNADLSDFNLRFADLTGATLTGVKTSISTKLPSRLPEGYHKIYEDFGIHEGYIVGPGVNLSGANLSNAGLAGVDLTGVDLSGANLSGTTLTGVTSGSITGTPTLPAAYGMFNGYIVGPGVDLTDVDLTDADLTGFNLSGANLSSADLSGTTLTDVASGSISGSPTLPAAYGMFNGYIVGPGVDLTNANLTGADLTGFNLSGANLSSANLSSATLTDVASGSISGSPTLPAAYGMFNGYIVGPGVDLTDVDLTGFDFTGFDLSGANLTGATLIGSTLTDVASGSITGTPTLPAAYGMYSGYIVGPGVNLSGANLSNAGLAGVDLTGVDLSGANLSSADLSGTTLTGVASGSISGTPTLPAAYGMFNGYIVGPGVDLTNANLTGC